MNDKARREAHWREHVSAWRASGLSRQAYCTARGLSMPSLGYWQQRLKSARPPVRAGRSEPHLTLVRRLIESPAEAPTPSLSIATRNGRRFDFPELPPANWLSALQSGAR